MKEDFELERVKEAIIGITKSKGLSIEETHEILDGNYKKNWDNKLHNYGARMANCIKLFEYAMKESDINAQKAFLIRAELVAHHLYNFFENISDDLKKIVFSEDFGFPELPEGYEVPEKYFHEKSD